MAARLGSRARGDAAHYLQKVEETPSRNPPALPREELHFLQAPFRIGVPASMNAGASLGFSRIGYQSSYIALVICGGEENILLRMAGTSSRGSEKARGKVGFCVRCARVTHIAAQIIYAAGKGGWLKEQDVKLRNTLGRGRHAIWRPAFMEISTAFKKIGAAR